MNHTSIGALPPVGPAEYANAMGQHVASVCVVATVHEGERYGLTATAVSSVSAAPPRILVCVNKSSFTHEKIVAAGRFCINVLAEDQDPVATAFAGLSGERADRFSVGSWTTLKTGAPALSGAAAAFDCLTAQTVDQFTHTIFIGDVVAVAAQLGEDSLLYGARKFRQLRKIFSALDAGPGEALHF